MFYISYRKKDSSHYLNKTLPIEFLQSKTYMEKVSLNGVKVYPFTSHEELLAFVSRHKGILVAINAEKILHATDQTRSIINRNIGYCDGLERSWR